MSAIVRMLTWFANRAGLPYERIRIQCPERIFQTSAMLPGERAEQDRLHAQRSKKAVALVIWMWCENLNSHGRVFHGTVV